MEEGSVECPEEPEEKDPECKAEEPSGIEQAVCEMAVCFAHIKLALILCLASWLLWT
jgi:hypothetical protein